MKRGVNSKRGLSPVVASVLMIMLVLFLAIMIFLWARGFINEQIEKFGQPIEELCSQINFEASLANGYNGYALEIVNRGNIDIYDFGIKMVREGDSEFTEFKFGADAGLSIVEDAPTLRMPDGNEPDEIIVYPMLLGSPEGSTTNKPFTCLDVGQVIRL